MVGTGACSLVRVFATLGIVALLRCAEAYEKRPLKPLCTGPPGATATFASLSVIIRDPDPPVIPLITFIAKSAIVRLVLLG